MLKKIIFSLMVFSLCSMQAVNIGGWFNKALELRYFLGINLGDIPIVIRNYYWSSDVLLYPWMNAGPHTQQFIKDIVCVYFPEIDSNKVHVLFGRSPAVINKSGEFYIVVPITDRALLLALNAYLDANGQEIISISDDYYFGDDKEDLYTEDQLLYLAHEEECSIEVMKQMLYRKFEFIDKSLFPLYVGVLIHEGAHILHNDGYYRLVHYSIPSLVHMSGFVGHMMYMMYSRHFIEGSADREAASRIDSSVVAQALADFFMSYSQQSPTKMSTMTNWLSLDTHPADIKRLELFAECARNIQDSNDSKFEQLIEFTCNQFRSKLGER